MSKNPNELVFLARKTKFLSLEMNLASPEMGNEKYMPFEDPAYSLFRVTAIDKGGLKALSPFANIPVKDLPAICVRRDAAMKIRVERELGGSGTQSDTVSGASAPYTAKFGFGSLSGKTVPQVLGDKPSENLPTLLKQRDFLQQNVAKFPKNQLMIDEIDRAEKEIKAGTYVADGSAEVPSDIVMVYHADNKPLRTHADSEGRALVYGIDIKCDLSRKDSPWIVEIRNCYAPLELNKATGQDLPSMSKAVNKATVSFSMGDQEFCYFLDLMTSTLQAYKQWKFPEQMRIMLEQKRMARESS